jgi:hypothetical protein
MGKDSSCNIAGKNQLPGHLYLDNAETDVSLYLLAQHLVVASGQGSVCPSAEASQVAVATQFGAPVFRVTIKPAVIK